MPYITREARERLFTPGNNPENPGELNFIITLLIDQYWHDNGQNYQAINDILGALEGAAAEFNRRRVAPYEEFKRLENGDVYRRVEEKTDGEGASEAPPEYGGEGLGGITVSTEGDPAEAESL